MELRAVTVVLHVYMGRACSNSNNQGIIFYHDIAVM